MATGRTTKEEEEAPTASSRRYRHRYRYRSRSTTDRRRRRRRRRQKQPKRLLRIRFRLFLHYFCCFYLISVENYLISLCFGYSGGAAEENTTTGRSVTVSPANRTTQAIDRCFSYKGGEFFLIVFRGFRIVFKPFACVCQQFHQPERQLPTTA